VSDETIVFGQRLLTAHVLFSLLNILSLLLSFNQSTEDLKDANSKTVAIHGSHDIVTKSDVPADFTFVHIKRGNWDLPQPIIFFFICLQHFICIFFSNSFSILTVGQNINCPVSGARTDIRAIESLISTRESLEQERPAVLENRSQSDDFSYAKSGTMTRMRNPRHTSPQSYKQNTFR
jgi:hypothetical protein